MKTIKLIAIALSCFGALQAQQKEVDFNNPSDLEMETEYWSEIEEIWDGKIVSDTIGLDSKNIGIKQFETLKDSIFKMKIVSKLTNNNKLKMTFKFPRFSVTKKYDAIKSDDYSLRNLAEESNLKIGYNEKFYLLAYILPYEREDGSKSWCEVGTSGDAIEKWGEKFGIKHYLLFEMKFE